MSEKSEIDLAVGRSLNRLRRERGLTLSGLSEAAGVSQGMLSKIENGQVSPSLVTLSALAAALGVPVMALLAENDATADVHFVKAGHGLASRRVARDHAHGYLLLGKHAGPGGSFQSARVRIEAGDAGVLPSYQHEGHVFLMVLSGSARYRCGSETFQMEAGDSLSFDAKLPHGFQEITGDHVEAITVSSRP